MIKEEFKTRTFSMVYGRVISEQYFAMPTLVGRGNSKYFSMIKEEMLTITNEI